MDTKVPENKPSVIKNELLKKLDIDSGYSLTSAPTTSKDTVNFYIENSTKEKIAFCIAGENISKELLIERFDTIEPNISLFFIFETVHSVISSYRRSFWDDSLNEVSMVPKFQKANSNLLSSILTSIPLGNNLENILFEAHSHLRDIDGLHADSALDEICKILFAKIYDEKQDVSIFNSNYANIDETSTVIRNLYNRAVSETLKGETLQLQKSGSVLKNGIKTSCSALNKLVSEFEKIDLTNSPLDIKGRAFQNLISPATRSGMGQYFTPKEVIDLIVKCIAPSSEETVIDPFCGSAHFLSESANRLVKCRDKDFDLERYVSNNLVGIDKSERMIRVGLTDMLLMEGVAPNLVNKDSLLNYSDLPNIDESGFDIVMTNPPFGSVLGKESFESLGEFKLLKGKSSLPLEVAGLERSIGLLKPNGKMAIVLPDSVLLNKSSLYVREWLKENVQIKAIISLPTETFSPFGANVKTSVLILVKRVESSPYNIFMASINNIGYDASGRKISKSDDLTKLENEFKSFIEKEGW